jgi:aspartyl-tRNA(Asn)/glutamyl-tRNA(Gln) amidotransferase subunit C
LRNLRYYRYTNSMASIDENEVKHLAELARIKLTDEEVPQLQKDLSKILEYVDALKQVKTDGLPEIAQVTGLKNSFRADEPRDASGTEKTRIMANAPAVEDGYVKVKAVFND